jgi:hypothetical protein
MKWRHGLCLEWSKGQAWWAKASSFGDQDQQLQFSFWILSFFWFSWPSFMTAPFWSLCLAGKSSCCHQTLSRIVSKGQPSSRSRCLLLLMTLLATSTFITSLLSCKGLSLVLLRASLWWFINGIQSIPLDVYCECANVLLPEYDSVACFSKMILPQTGSVFGVNRSCRIVCFDYGYDSMISPGADSLDWTSENLVSLFVLWKGWLVRIACGNDYMWFE